MAYLLRPIKDFFVTSGPRTTPEWIRLQFRTRSENDPRPASDETIDCDGVLPMAHGELKPKTHYLHLYAMLRFFKVLAVSWNARFPGWQSGVAAFSILASITLILNISALIWAANDLDDKPYATIAMGTFDEMSKLSGKIHFCINVLSTVLLAGSNYCLQCLSSPTRQEVDVAHSRGSNLRIGVLSWKNILARGKMNLCHAVLLISSSAALHVTYDASVVTTNAFQAYDIALVTPRFLSGGAIPIWPETMGSIHDQRHEIRLARLQALASNGQIWNESRWSSASLKECDSQNTQQLVSDGGSMLIVAYLDIPVPYARHDPGSVVKYHYFSEPFNWHYEDPPGLQDSEYPGLRCFNLKVPGRCRVQLHAWFLLAITITNATKLTCLLFTFKRIRGNPLLTMGDAIASFLQSPCKHTSRSCLLSGPEFVKIRRHQEQEEDAGETFQEKEAKTYGCRPLRYYESTGYFRWAVYVSSCIILMFVSGYLCQQIDKNSKKGLYPIMDDIHYPRQMLPFYILATPVVKLPGPYIWKQRFGNLRYESSGKISPPWCSLYGSGQDRITCRYLGEDYFHMLIATTPQLIVSTLYLGLNYHLTAMIQLRDWRRLGTKRQPLRVSSPESNSDQLSTYWLSLPHAYSVPALLSSSILSWLLSQTLHFYRHRAYDNDGERFIYRETPGQYRPFSGDTQVFQGLGYSPFGLICSLVFGTIVFITSLAVGLQKCAPGPPLGPSNSLVIAAACHPPANDYHAARKLVRWGTIHTEGSTGRRNAPHHCTITSRKVESPVVGKWYT